MPAEKRHQRMITKSTNILNKRLEYIRQSPELWKDELSERARAEHHQRLEKYKRRYTESK